jgi:hypothetical protein
MPLFKAKIPGHRRLRVHWPLRGDVLAGGKSRIQNTSGTSIYRSNLTLGKSVRKERVQRLNRIYRKEVRLASLFGQHCHFSSELSTTR